MGKAKEIDPIDKLAGSKLKLARTIKGMSQTMLGNSIGVTFQQIQKYEKGINRMSASRLYKLSKILEVPISYFFQEISEEHPEEKMLIDFEMPKTLVKIIKVYKKLSSKEVESLLAFLSLMQNYGNKNVKVGEEEIVD